MNTLEALGILAGIGVAGYIGYEYVSKGASTSTTTTGATPSYYPIGQATPYETTGHLEDPLINELLNAVNSLKQQISSQTSPVISPTYPTTTTTPNITTTPTITTTTSSTTVTTPTITTTPTKTTTTTTTTIPTPSPFPTGGGWYSPLPTTSTTNTTTTPTPSPTGSGWYSPLPPPSIASTVTSAISKVIQTGASVNTAQASQIQNYNPYYQPGTPTTASSKIGSAITGAVVTALGGPQSKLAQEYLNVTRPVVTTAEAVYHPQIQAFNQAVSSVENVAKQAEQTISQTAQQYIPQAQQEAQKVVETVGNSAASAVKSVESAFGSWFSHL